MLKIGGEEVPLPRAEKREQPTSASSGREKQASLDTLGQALVVEMGARLELLAEGGLLPRLRRKLSGRWPTAPAPGGDAPAAASPVRTVGSVTP